MKKIVTICLLLAHQLIISQTIYVYAPGWDIPLYFDAVGVTKEFEMHDIVFKQVSSPHAIPSHAKALFFDVDPVIETANACLSAENCILFLWEPITIKPYNFDSHYHTYFNRIYTWHDNLVDNVRYFKMNYPVRHDMRPNHYTFDQKKLCVMVTANKPCYHNDSLYSQRVNIIDFFNTYHPNEFDLYGAGWPSSLVYRGIIDDKLSLICGYKFSIVYENTIRAPGYISEKIFDCYISACVPIYWGAPNITEYIPKACFIDRNDFKSNEDLYTYISTMNEETHQQYITAIQQFLMSNAAHKFSSKAFIELLKSIYLS